MADSRKEDLSFSFSFRRVCFPSTRARGCGLLFALISVIAFMFFPLIFGFSSLLEVDPVLSNAMELVPASRHSIYLLLGRFLLGN